MGNIDIAPKSQYSEGNNKNRKDLFLRNMQALFASLAISLSLALTAIPFKAESWEVPQGRVHERLFLLKGLQIGGQLIDAIFHKILGFLRLLIQGNAATC